MSTRHPVGTARTDVGDLQACVEIYLVRTLALQHSTRRTEMIIHTYSFISIEEEEEEEFYKLLPANKADHLCHRMARTTDVYLPMKSRQSIMK